MRKARISLEEWENDEIAKAFKKAGIKFGDNFSVTLEKSDADETEKKPRNSSGEGARIVIGAGLAILSDSSNMDGIDVGLPRVAAQEEEKEKRKDD